uniref:Uncharacterized protein n=1 Tax=Strombidium rassoulzadegani TaxID=1082188 RepID=A0A7S3CPY6_9SPIT|mmetsp:Transcript_2723/g.4626  ORF Transcript_2723/g.4626 Transcript_2723/m.4626 type:complete len:163 (+) Transcript_2723:187-675(+)
MFDVVNPQVSLLYNGNVMNLKTTKKGHFNFDKEFSVKILGIKNLAERVVIQFKDGDKVVGETKMKFQTLLNGGSIVNPCQFTSLDQLKMHYAMDRENWYPLFKEETPVGQIKLETMFRSQQTWEVDQKHFRKENNSLWKYILCGTCTVAAASGAAAYTLMDS